MSTGHSLSMRWILRHPHRPWVAYCSCGWDGHPMPDRKAAALDYDEHIKGDGDD